MKKLFFLFLIFYLSSPTTYAKEALWKQIYFNGVNKSTDAVTNYCIKTTPGIFVGTVKEELANGAITNKSIQLKHFTVHQYKNAYGYLMMGTVKENSLSSSTIWHDIIFYALTKPSVYGTTTGIWYNSQCKGAFLGYVIGWK